MTSSSCIWKVKRTATWGSTSQYTEPPRLKNNYNSHRGRPLTKIYVLLREQRLTSPNHVSQGRSRQSRTAADPPMSEQSRRVIFEPSSLAISNSKLHHPDDNPNTRATAPIASTTAAAIRSSFQRR